MSTMTNDENFDILNQQQQQQQQQQPQMKNPVHNNKLHHNHNHNHTHHHSHSIHHPRKPMNRKATTAKPKNANVDSNDSTRLTVVIDLDETLIHSRLDNSQLGFRQEEERKQDVKACDEFTIKLSDGEVVRVNKRPGLDAFLKTISMQHDVVIFTAGVQAYAEPLVNRLDPDNTIFAKRLYRDSCTFVRGHYVKDLSKIGTPMSRTVLTDNNAICFLPQLANGIPISSFFDDPNDSALTVLQAFLDKLATEPDVRPMLRKSFNLENLLAEHRRHILGM